MRAAGSRAHLRKRAVERMRASPSPRTRCGRYRHALIRRAHGSGTAASQTGGATGRHGPGAARPWETASRTLRLRTGQRGWQRPARGCSGTARRCKTSALQDIAPGGTAPDSTVPERGRFGRDSIPRSTDGEKIGDGITAPVPVYGGLPQPPRRKKGRGKGGEPVAFFRKFPLFRRQAVAAAAGAARGPGTLGPPAPGRAAGYIRPRLRRNS